MAMTVGELNAFLGLDASQFDKKLDKAERDADAFSKKGVKAKADMDIGPLRSKFSAIGGLIANNTAQMKNMGAKMSLGVTLPVIAGMGYMVKAASDLAESVDKTTVVFKDQAQAVIDWSENSAEAMGLSKQAALESAGTFGNLFVSMGVGEGQAAEMSMTLTQLAGDLASLNNTPVDEAVEALRSGITGETEPLKRFGVVLNEAALKAKALAMGLDVTGATLDPLVKQQAAYALIMERTTTAQGNYALTADGVANSSKTAMAEVQTLAASFGTELLPIMKDALGVIKPMVGFFTDLPTPIKKTFLALSLGVAALGPGIWLIAQAVDAFRGLSALWKTIRSTITAADTVAIGRNTVAVEANTLARGRNLLMPPVGAQGVAPQLAGTPGLMGAGLAPGTAGAGAAGLGALGTAGAMGAATASALVAGAFAYTLATYNQPGGSPSGATTTGGPSGVGRMGAASQERVEAEIRPRLKRIGEGMSQLNELIGEIDNLRPSEATIGATSRYEQKLKDLAVRFPEIAGQVHETADALREGAEEFESAAEAAAAAMDQIKQSVMSEATTVFEAMSKLAIQGIRMTGEELAQVTANTMEGVKYPKNWKPLPNADNKGRPLPRSFATGGEFLTSGPQLLLVGDNPGGVEHVSVTPSGSPRSGGRSVVVNLNFNAPVVGGKAGLRELSRIVQGDVMAGVQRGLVGQNG